MGLPWSVKTDLSRICSYCRPNLLARYEQRESVWPSAGLFSTWVDMQHDLVCMTGGATTLVFLHLALSPRLNLNGGAHGVQQSRNWGSRNNSGINLRIDRGESNNCQHYRYLVPLHCRLRYTASV